MYTKNRASRRLVNFCTRIRVKSRTIPTSVNIKPLSSIPRLTSRLLQAPIRTPTHHTLGPHIIPVRKQLPLVFIPPVLIILQTAVHASEQDGRARLRRARPSVGAILVPEVLLRWMEDVALAAGLAR